MNEVPEFREHGIAAIRLLQGVIYEDDKDAWSIVLSNESDLTDYFYQIGLSLVIDRAEGMAYLRQFHDDERTDGYERLPRLFRKTPLSYEATLLCAVLRDEYRKFEEQDVDNERCVVAADALLDEWKAYCPSEADEVTLRKRLVALLNQLEKMKFVKRIASDTDSWEVRKLLKARLPLDELDSLRERLLASVEKLKQT